MDVLPIFFKVKDQACLVVGGGEIASRKIRLLLSAGARVHVVAPQLAPSVEKLVASRDVQHRCGTFEATDLDAVILVIAATNQKPINAQVSMLAKQQGLPVNVVDSPELCSFFIPSIIDRSPIVVAVSSGGASPVLARLLRVRLETVIPASYGRLAHLVKGFREKVKERFQDISIRRRFWEQVLQGPIAEMMFSGQEQLAHQALQQALNENANSIDKRGEVYLVGAGPGDPDLLTFRALRLLQQADVIVYDRLVSAPVLELARRDAERIYVGKKRSEHTVPQEQINQLLARLAKEGKRVVRLKGGDPFIFGRGGEEISTLMEEGIAFQVVPGITAASGCSAYAGIPLTHRDYSQSVVFATGHLKDNSVNLNWSSLVQPQQTIVFYMGLIGLTVICQQLIIHGLAPTTPIAIIQQGTTPNQKVLVATLETMPDMCHESNLQPPTLIIVGDVVKLHNKLAWFGG